MESDATDSSPLRRTRTTGELSLNSPRDNTHRDIAGLGRTIRSAGARSTDLCVNEQSLHHVFRAATRNGRQSELGSYTKQVR